MSYNHSTIVGLPTNEERAWAAGFFDGEGYVAYHNRKTAMHISQAGPQRQLLLDRFQRAVGGLGIQFELKPPTKKNWNQASRWDVSSFQVAQQVIIFLWPWLGPVKRVQWMKTRAAWQAVPRYARQNQYTKARRDGLPCDDCQHQNPSASERG